MPIITLEHVKKAFRVDGNEILAVRDADFSIENGEFAAIEGRSGSGKTTLMNILGCLDRQDSGRYLLNGHDMSKCGDAYRSYVRGTVIGFVFQGFHLIPRLTAAENVELPLVYRGFRPAECHRLAEQALESVGLSERMTHVPSRLSGGQQQRVAIARALAACPELILADEPTGNLDSESGRDILGILREQNRRGVTVILITHDRAVAKLANRRITIENGEITSDSGRTADGTARQDELLP